MKSIGAFFSVLFGGLIIVWFLFINLPRLLEQLSLFNSSNAHGIAAIAGALLGNSIILIAGVVLLRSGVKRYNGDGKEKISERGSKNDISSSCNNTYSIKKTEEEIAKEELDRSLNLSIDKDSPEKELKKNFQIDEQDFIKIDETKIVQNKSNENIGLAI